MRFVYGSYVGDGVDDRAIDAGVGGGETLKFLLVSRFSSTPAGTCRFDLGGDLSFRTGDQTGAAGLIKSFTAGGFVVGTDAAINGDGVTYYYWGLTDTGSGDLVTGSYTGNGSDNRDLAYDLGGETAAFIVVRGNLAVGGASRTADIAGDASTIWLHGNLAANLVQAVGADTFQVGNSTRVNGNGSTYYFVAAKATPAVFATLSYVGNGADARSISGAGFEPHLALLLGTSLAVQRTASMSSSMRMSDGVTSATLIQALESDGFRVGTSTSVNDDGVTYYAVCMRDSGIPPAPSRSRLSPYYFFVRRF